MQSRFWQFAILLVLCLVAQGLIFSNVEIRGFLMPFPYVIGILLLPVELPSILVLTVAFFLGLFHQAGILPL